MVTRKGCSWLLGDGFLPFCRAVDEIGLYSMIDWCGFRLGWTSLMRPISPKWKIVYKKKKKSTENKKIGGIVSTLRKWRSIIRENNCHSQRTLK